MTALGEYLERAPRYGIGAAAVPHALHLPTYIRITDIDAYGRFCPNPAVSVDSPSSSNYLLKEGDLVIARTGASVGKSYRYRARDGALVFAGFLVAIHPDDRRLDPRYLEYFLQSKRYWDWIASESMRSGQPGVNAQQIARLDVEVPAIDEQRAIAGALGDADRLIEALERMIAKKRDVKQGMMQALLAGPGGGVRISRLSDVALKIQDGTHFSPTLGGDEYRYITSRNIGEGVMRLDQVEMISAAEHRKIYTRCDVRLGDLLLTKDGANTGNVAINPFEDEISLLSSVAFVRCNPLHASEQYVLQYMLSRPGRQQIRDAMAGNAITRLTLDKIRKLVLPLPPVDEQRRVAQVLGDADGEIAALERRLEVARAVKTGMMQELLTRRTRLPMEAAS